MRKCDGNSPPRGAFRNLLERLKDKRKASREIFRRGYAIGVESKLYLTNLEKRKGEMLELIKEMEKAGIISKEEGEKTFLMGYKVGEKDGEEIISKGAKGKFSEVLQRAFEVGGEDAGKILIANMKVGMENPKEVIYELIETIFPLLEYIIYGEEEFSEELIENLREVLLPFYWFLMEGEFKGLKEALLLYWRTIDEEFGMPLPVGG